MAIAPCPGEGSICDKGILKKLHSYFNCFNLFKPALAKDIFSSEDFVK